jgi:Zn-dependent peptidase ImmA (M78 family)
LANDVGDQGNFMNTVPASVPVLHWAAKRARLDDAAVSQRFRKWPQWLSGEEQPTLRQLEDFARFTHTAIGYFFLPEPPVLPLPVPDFRTLRDEALAEPSSELLDTLYLCQQRQDWYHEYARMHGLPPLSFIGSVTVDNGVEDVARRICNTLGLSTESRRELPTRTDALRQMITLAEAAGVMVMASSIVGSNSHRKLDVGEFRGFVLADNLAPLVFLNSADSKAAQMFTLAHELTHLWLGATGVLDTQAGQVPDQQIERWCSQVAAEVLKSMQVASAVHCFEEQDRLRKLEARDSGGGDFYRALGIRTSKRFAKALVASTLEGQTLFQDAFRMLGVRKTATFYEAAHELGVMT